MAKEVNTRVVQMKFDNSQFQKGVSQTLSSLDDLKERLKFKDANKGFEELTKESNAFGEALDTIKVKFSALQVVAITALTNITNKAINAGEQLVKSLSIDNIATGWQKFEETTSSVGTLISQGFSMDEVEEQLDRLNWFTDETSYNFTDMVNNIGKFTATGQSLDTSVQAMMGIANWAALSGANAQKASSAMYQLAQAMGKGALKYDDYKSIQNVNMDTREFRQTALDAAEALGTLKKTADGTYETLKGNKFNIDSFGTYLSSDAWLTSDVMIQAFNRYSSAVNQLYDATNGVDAAYSTASDAIEGMGNTLDEFGLKAFKAAQEARTWSDVISSVKDAVSSKWKDTFTIIFGNYEEAKWLFTKLANKLYDVFAEPGNVRNEILEFWNGENNEGRKRLLDTFAAAILTVRDAINQVKEAWHSVFGKKDTKEKAASLMEFTKKVQMFFVKLRIGVQQRAEQIQRIFKGIFSVVKLVKDIVVTFVKSLSPAFATVGSIGDIALELAAKLGDSLYSLTEWIRQMGLLEWIAKTVTNILEGLKSVFEFVSEKIGKFSDKLKDITTNSEKLNNVLLSSGGIVTTLFTMFGVVSLTGVILSNLMHPLKAITGLITGIKDIVGSVVGILTNLRKKMALDILSTTVNIVLAAIASIGILAGAIYLLGSLDTKQLIQGSIAVGVLVGVIVLIANGLAIISQKTNVILKWTERVNRVGLVSIGASLFLLAASVGILALAVKSLGDYEGNLKRGMVAIGALMFMIDFFAKSVAKIGTIKDLQGKTLKQVASSIFVISVSLTLLANTLMRLASFEGNLLPAYGVLAALAGLVELMVGINTGISNHFKETDNIVKNSWSVVISAGALILLAESLIKLANLSVRQIIKGGITIAALAVVIEVMTHVNEAMSVNFRKGENILRNSWSTMISVGSIILLAEEFIKLGTVSIPDILQASLILGGLIIVVESITKFNAKLALATKESANVIRNSVSAILSVSAIMLLAGAVAGLSKITDYTSLWNAVGIITVLSFVAVGIEFFNRQIAGATKLKGNIIRNAASALISIAGIMLLAGAVAGLSKITDYTSLWNAVGIITVLSFVAVGIEALLQTISMIPGTGTTILTALSLLIVGLVISGFAFVIKQLADITIPEAWNAVGVLAVLGLLVAGLAFVVNKLSAIPTTGIAGMFTGVAAIGLLLGEIWLLSLILNKFKDDNFEHIIEIAAGVGAFIAILGAIVWGLQEAIDVSKIANIIVGLAAIAGLAAIIDLLVIPTFKELGKVNWTKALFDTVKMSAALVILVAALNIIGTIVLSNIPGMIAAAVAIGVIATIAMETLVPAIVELADSIEKIAKIVKDDPVKKVVNSIIEGAKEISASGSELETAMSEVGNKVVDGIIIGINNKLEDAKTAGKKVTNSVYQGLMEGVGDPTIMAGYTMAGVILTLYQYLQSAYNAGHDVGQAVEDGYEDQQGIASPALAMVKAALYSMLGIVKGIGIGQPIVKEAMEDVGNDMEQVIEDEEVPLGDKVESTMEAAMSKGDGPVKSHIAAWKQWFIDAWNTIVNSMNEKRKVEMEITKETNRIIKENVVDPIAKALSPTKKLEDEIDKLSEKVEELANNGFNLDDYNFENAEELFGPFQDALSEASKKSQDLTKSVSDIGSSASKTKSQLESLKDTIKSQISLFSQFNKQVEMVEDEVYDPETNTYSLVQREKTGAEMAEEMLSNMESQIFGVTEWSNNLARLAMRGMDQGLLEMLGEMGPQAYQKVQAFVNMTDEQLQRANYLYATSTKLPDYASNEVYASFKYAGEMATKGFSSALDKYKGIMDLYDIGEVSIEQIDKGMNDALTIFKKKYTKNDDSGEIVNSLKMPIEKYGIPKLRNLGISMATVVNEGVCETLDMHSPSRVMEDNGINTLGGLKLGLENEDAVNGVVSAMVAAVQAAIDAANEVLAMNTETLTVTPVLNLSEIQNGAGSLSSWISSREVSVATAAFNAKIAADRELIKTQIDNTRILVNTLNANTKSVTDAIAASDTPVNVNLTLQGDSAQLFKLVRQENAKFTKINGYNALAY